MGYCGTWSLVSRDEDKIVAVPLRCKKWDCPVCCHRNRRKLISALKAVKVDSLLTLTCSSRSFPTPRHAFDRLSNAIPHLMKRIRRRWPRAEVQYFLVWETTRQGWPHAHVLLRAPYLPQKWLSLQWAELTQSPIVDIRKAGTADSIGSYLSKYMSKQPQVPLSSRRYRSSVSFWPTGCGPTRTPPLGGSLWHVSQNPTLIIRKFYEDCGWAVRENINGAVTCIPPPHGGGLFHAPRPAFHQAAFALDKTYLAERG